MAHPELSLARSILSGGVTDLGTPENPKMAAARLVSLKVGEYVSFVAHGHNFGLKRIDRSAYHLWDESISERSRFGTRQEIRSDVEYALTYGTLPPPAGPRW